MVSTSSDVLVLASSASSGLCVGVVVVDKYSAGVYGCAHIVVTVGISRGGGGNA